MWISGGLVTAQAKMILVGLAGSPQEAFKHPVLWYNVLPIILEVPDLSGPSCFKDFLPVNRRKLDSPRKKKQKKNEETKTKKIHTCVLDFHQIRPQRVLHQQLLHKHQSCPRGFCVTLSPFS